MSESLPLESRTVILLSHATGETAWRVLERVRAQFPKNTQIIDKRIINVRNPQQIRVLMEVAAVSKALVFYTLVDETLVEVARKAASDYGVEAVDILGPAMEAFARWQHAEPVRRSGHRGNPDYIAAIHFAEDHDDGQMTHELPLADVVVLGLSRASKTPVCQALARHGICAANVPIVRN